jgi:hypothetical protein
MVRQDFPTPPPPTTTNLYSRRNYHNSHRQRYRNIEQDDFGAKGSREERRTLEAIVLVSILVEFCCLPPTTVEVRSIASCWSYTQIELFVCLQLAEAMKLGLKMLRCAKISGNVQAERAVRLDYANGCIEAQQGRMEGWLSDIGGGRRRS